LIPGDGIGAEVAESVKEVFKADNVPVEWEQVDVSGVESGAKHSEELFRESIASLKRNKIGLKGILHTPVERSGHQSFNVAMRQELDIYASIVLIKNIPGYKTRHDNVDLCIIRENTEGEYSGLEHQVSLNPSRLLPAPSQNALQSSHLALHWQTTAKRSPVSTRPTS
jgi:isocitrate dehydrogenase (NAD+)